MKPSFLIVPCAALAGAALLAGAPLGRQAAVAATPPPTPPPITQPAQTPQPSASLAPTPAATLVPLPVGTSTPKPSKRPTPAPQPVRKGLDGVWEVQIQRSDSTDYTHFNLTQNGDALTGTYLDSRKKKYPLVGTVDGQDIRMIVSLPNGTTLLLEGKVDGSTDMVGMLTSAAGQVPFTASYRAKEKWIENVNPSPGGIPQPGSYTPP